MHEFIWEVVPGSRDKGIQSKTGREQNPIEGCSIKCTTESKGLDWPGPPKKCTEHTQNYAPEEWKVGAFIHMSQSPVGDEAPEDIYSPTLPGSSVAQAKQASSLSDGPREERR